MQFTKMQGCGNDYIYVNAMEERVESPGRLAKAVSDRHFGIGGDGLVLICPSERADFCMEMYNADGSRSEMCGNAIRCVGKYVYDRGLTDKTELTIETRAGIKTLWLNVADGAVETVRVWERGSGETLACGTGATAALAVTARLGKCGDEADVLLRGGKLHIAWDRSQNLLYMTGPAAFVFDGTVTL